LDPESNRPLAGFTNFCPNALITDAAAFQAQLETAIHETLHALVFSTTLFSKYVGQDGKPLGRSNVIKQSVEQGRNVRKVVTPTVVREARAHFGCNTLDGAEIENEGKLATISLLFGRIVIFTDILMMFCI
jgi:leishmanolysin-like peptidase